MRALAVAFGGKPLSLLASRMQLIAVGTGNGYKYAHTAAKTSIFSRSLARKDKMAKHTHQAAILKKLFLFSWLVCSI